MKHSVSCIAIVSLIFILASEGWCQAQHFDTSYSNFVRYLDKAAQLYFDSDDPSDKNILSHFTATTSLFAEKSYLFATLLEIFENMKSEGDKTYVKNRIEGVRTKEAGKLENMIDITSRLVDTADNKGIQFLGYQIINEMRILRRNIDHLNLQ
ncbi:hypothetical protein [Desulfovibrio inopinatus]|uniref:hypothetical protein n=1 Tax=Desulfovibrio inopinatus TaxID=102109 RepID=UPI0004162733|nr:hypothetical protein [Desulfovibrio inopinatus]